MYIKVSGGHAVSSCFLWRHGQACLIPSTVYVTSSCSEGVEQQLRTQSGQLNNSRRPNPSLKIRSYEIDQSGAFHERLDQRSWNTARCAVK